MSKDGKHWCHDCGAPADNAVEVKNGTDTDRGWYEWLDTEYLCNECLEEWEEKHESEYFMR
jgi:hypothetical protein